MASTVLRLAIMLVHCLGETHEEQGKFTISRSTYMGLPFIMSAIERVGGGEVFMEK